MRSFALTLAASGVAAVAGLMTYEVVALVLSGLAFVVALVALVQSNRTARDIKRLAAEQGERIVALDERRED